jgi:hypothetical protein
MKHHVLRRYAIVGAVTIGVAPLGILAVSPPAGAAGCAAGWSATGSGSCRLVLAYDGSQPGDPVAVRGTVQTVAVPPGVTSLSVVAAGAAGAASASASFEGSPGGLGGQQSATVAVVPGDTLSVYVGEQGASVPQTPALGWQVSGAGGGTTTSGAFGGGGMTASNQAGFGGGGSFVFDGRPNPAAPTGVGNLLVAAGGGGGGGYDYNTDGSYGTLYAIGRNVGGAGGGTGADGQSVGTLLASPPVCNDPAGGGLGATATAAGAGGHSVISGGCMFGQADGSAGAGPAVLPDPAQVETQNQYLGTGGSGVMGSPTFQWGGGYGGGGGGGYFGGGGGGTINGDLEGGGGGGGSGYSAPGATGVTSAVGVQHGDGQVTLSYSLSGGGTGAAITSAASGTATTGVPFSFVVTTSGPSVPKIKVIGHRPKGVVAVDQHDGTAVLSGTPTSTRAKPAAGTYPLTVRATFGAGRTKQVVTQAFTLVVG